MDLIDRYPQATRIRFGDGPELSAWLLGLIRAGRKTATCGSLKGYEDIGEPIPRPGDIVIADDWDGRPALAYRVTQVDVVPFDQVSEDFALAEGEGDYGAWHAGHEAYFARNAAFDPAMPIVCERFEVIATAEDSEG